MVAVKQEVQEIIHNLPDDCTYEDIQYHLYVVEKIKNGISRAENGEISSHQDAKKRMDRWLSNFLVPAEDGWERAKVPVFLLPTRMLGTE